MRSYLKYSVCHIGISNSNVGFAFHGIHATFFNKNSYVYDEHHASEKTLDGFKHMTYKVAQQT